MRKAVLIIFLLIASVLMGFYYFSKSRVLKDFLTDLPNMNLEEGVLDDQKHPLSIPGLKEGSYPGSDIVIEETLSTGSNYKRYRVSYLSEGLKIYALLTIPNGNPPDGSGWPVIVFNHGYIPPREYKTTEKYIAYTDAFARSGYVLLKPDYRGHGESEGEAVGSYGSSGYTIDVLNAAASIKKYPGVNPNKIGMWGHSMGGHITLRNMVVSRDIKAGVIWAGVVGSYPDLLQNWRRRNPDPSPNFSVNRRRWREELLKMYGEPSENPEFWNSISANSYLNEIGPLQLHHGTMDTSVPVEFSQTLESQMKNAGREVELFTYSGDDHNISKNFSIAMKRSLEFFDKYLKS